MKQGLLGAPAMAAHRGCWVSSGLLSLAACACGDSGAYGNTPGSDQLDAAGGERDGGATAPGDHDAAATTDAGPDSGPAGDAGPGPIGDAGPEQEALPGELDDLALAMIVGDSVAAGRNADDGNEPGGQGFARLVVDNHPDFPSYEGHFLRALSPATEFRRVTESGAQSSDALANLRTALNRRLPEEVDGDVLVMIHVGGNDFNDNPLTMVSASRTEDKAAALRDNLAEMMHLLGERYEDPGSGKSVVFLVDNIHDPTDGTARVPLGHPGAWCVALANPLFTDETRQDVVDNLARMNEAIADEAAAEGALLVDVHAALMGHGMNANDEDRAIDEDCIHPTNEGHHLIRQAVWEVLTGRRY